MIDIACRSGDAASELPARDWIKVLSTYREPILWRSLWELAVTVVPFFALWAAAWWALSVGYWLTLLLCIPTAGFLVRLFLIQHDCGHGAFFKRKPVNDWVGRVIGVLTLTPYDVWRKCHAMHHAGSGNLDARGVGDIATLTVREYRERSFWGRLGYRLYRHPVTLFVFGPAYVYLLQNRLPVGVMREGKLYWISAMGTNLAIGLLAAAMIWAIGLVPFLQIYFPVTLIAATIGIWLFYVQHQFEETVWDEPEGWQVHEAALHGSSHYILPGWLRWMSANIGVHHVHHLYARIPFYRLSQVLRDHPPLAESNKLTLMESFRCVKLVLWDEERRRLVSYAEARTL